MAHRAFSQGDQSFLVYDQYDYIRGMGQGAYGMVCAARNKSNGFICAIKKVHSLFDRVLIAKRTLRELKLLQHFNGHKNVCFFLSITALSDDSYYSNFNEIYFYQELMDEDLHNILATGHPLTDDHFQYFMYQICCGLKYIHSANVLHRDLKPSNLLVNTECELKICDFGLARGYVAAGSDDTANMTGYVATRWYRAPEILLNPTTYTKALDMWSVGCIFAELLGGKPLFRGTGQIDQIHQILHVLGTPSEMSLQNVNEDTSEYIRSLGHLPGIQFADLYPTATPLALDLLSKLLTFDPIVRITAEEVLKHPYVKIYHDPENEPRHGTIVDFSFEGLRDIAQIKKVMIEEVQSFKARKHSLHLDLRNISRQR
ncbi:kinase-like domain-containing protein [Pilobolus umbonatus]|nr:kinase-like domain-containing protein [Pilobolus umbonatus]